MRLAKLTKDITMHMHIMSNACCRKIPTFLLHAMGERLVGAPGGHGTEERPKDKKDDGGRAKLHDSELVEPSLICVLLVIQMH